MRRAVLPLSGTEAGRAPLSVGAGGDTTMELDARAEQVVFAELANLSERGEKFSVLSEEAGLRSFGADYPLLSYDRLRTDWATLDLTVQVREKLFHRNAERLFAELGHDLAQGAPQR